MERNNIISTLKKALKNNEDIIAFWEAGSASFGNNDKYSDIDLQIMCKKDKVDKTIKLTESIIRSIAEIKNKFIVPQPSWHGHWQGFYQFEGLNPFLMLDLVIIKEGSKNLFLESKIHGKPIVYIDRKNIIKDHPINYKELNAKIKNRTMLIKRKTDFFSIFVDKGIKRKHACDAFDFYQMMILRPLAELIRMKYCKERYDFGLRYLWRDIPRNLYKKIEYLYFVKNLKDLKKKSKIAMQLMDKTLKSLRKQ